MLGAAFVLLGVVAIGGSAALLAACLRIASLGPYLLAAYLIGCTEIALSTVFLTPVHAITRLWLATAAVAWLALGLTIWRSTGRPPPPVLRPRVQWLIRTLREPAFALLAGTVMIVHAYLVVLALATPQNEEDALVYHLTRAALWRQDGAIGIVGTELEPRLDGNPIFAETLQTWLLTLAGSERFVWLMGYLALGALALGAFALARRAGLGPRSALLSALVVPTLPVIALQAGTGLNDLVVASFLVAAAVFVTGTVGLELVALALAVALAVATKFTTPFLAPLVVVVAAVAQPRRRWAAVATSMLAGAAGGSGWYLVNEARTGSPDGGLADWSDQHLVRTVPSVLVNVQRLMLDAVEVPGAQGRGYLLYAIAGLGLAVGGSMLAMVRRTTLSAPLIAGALVALLPLATAALAAALRSTFGAFWERKVESGFAEEMRTWSLATVPDATTSWFGPLGVAVGVTALGLAIRSVRRRSARAVAIALALAPWIGIGILAVSLNYDPWRGRLLVAAWVMSAATWGLVSNTRAGALGLATGASVTLVLCAVGFLSKPLGAGWLTGTDAPSVWSLDRWEVQTAVRGGGAPVDRDTTKRAAGEAAVIGFLDERVRGGEEVAVVLGENDFAFPLFGASLDRQVVLLDHADPVPTIARWLATAPGLSALACTGAWSSTLVHPSGWRVRSRVARGRCDDPALLPTSGSP